MKKSILTLTFLALFTVAAQAQDTKTKTTKEETPKTKTVNNDGTPVTPPTAVSETENKEEAAPVKKGGTRMAINEKGTSGGIKPKATSKTEDKKTETPVAQPGSGKKD